MGLGLNYVDLIIVIVLLLFVLDSLGRSFILEFLDLLSFVLAAFLSFNFYYLPSNFIERQMIIAHGLSLVIGFMVVWFITETSFYFLVRMFWSKVPQVLFPGAKYFSVVPAFLKGIIFIALILVMIATFPMQPSIKKSVLDSGLGSQILKHAYSLERPLKTVFGGIANDSLTFLTVDPKTTKTVNLGFTTSEFSVDLASENKMLILVNTERAKNGLKILEPDQKLRTIAISHGEDMLKRGYFSHYSPEGLTVADRATNAGIDFLVVGENLAYAPSVELAEQGLMNSPGHRANILSPDYGKIGIGAIDAGVYGKMFVQVFAN